MIDDVYLSIYLIISKVKVRIIHNDKLQFMFKLFPPKGFSFLAFQLPWRLESRAQKEGGGGGGRCRHEGCAEPAARRVGRGHGGPQEGQKLEDSHAPLVGRANMGHAPRSTGQHH